MQGENADRKKRVDAYIQRIKFSEITGDGETDKRIEYLWNLALSTVYENAKLSMKYITLIKKITRNNVLFDDVCCHYCNLIYIPFYNCEIKQIVEKNAIRYRCLLCKHKKHRTLRNCQNQVKNAIPQNLDGRKVRTNPPNWDLFLINEIDKYGIKKETPGDETDDAKAQDDIQGNIPLGNVKEQEDLQGDNPVEDTPPLNNNQTDEPLNQAIPLDSMRDLFTIDYGNSICTIKKEILLPMTQNNNCGINHNLKNLNSAEKNNNAQKKRKHDGSIKCEEKSGTVKEAIKIDNLSNAQEKAVSKMPSNQNKVNSVNNVKKSNVTKVGKGIPNLGTTDNYLNFNKSKKKKKNILDIL
ncbi:RNAse P, putative [Plasmodium knowlesi strain H]|uniref:RNAse P, putative n=3 Tax=Plasmodium knowlesi TaxID=5850 RepID=A0A5K1UKW0_PLAKH|nr:conserved Plasmodium protein, unknown function [Plasmodium knowlesi strain H]OTN64954.1 putative RNAse P [Plasmodium knowlesi]CAA9988159.1 conserved Plasmodium protein, unknown function [Plasmodium knowlesi strain H]SBO20062.1 RNAse P, putative [Plasmodium knowlesi strain H]SBO20761.1 RNAse P, putative [Plasmodium knowlesi strain H]VVS77633.1 conserved Plasmodium protein, unknown function [Plasmodium knowlesi strain H]|eukprot:XP_002259135.1 hypothetical protein, conserved in Plasmodium species [Plasmodium knowlesi strain H]